MEAAFWISVFILFYTYIGYGLLLFLLNLVFFSKKRLNGKDLPALTFIVPAYNEEDVISAKIANSFSLDYPQNKVCFIFITDGSTDKTPEIVAAHNAIRQLYNENRLGKSAAINRAMEIVQTPIVVFSDANIMLHPNSLRKLVQHYSDEKVGGVSGEKRIVDNKNSPVSFSERLYWRYESLLKKANSDFYTLVGAAGELFSIRTRLFQPLDTNIILDDFVISANVCRQGYRFGYESEAYGYETSSLSMDEEKKRKIRISAGCYQAFVLFTSLLNPFKNFKAAFQYISHRVLRWIVCPLLIPVVFLTNLLLVLNKSEEIYLLFFYAQCTFYLLGLIGWMLAEKKLIPKFLLLPYYFLFMIFCQYTGFSRFLKKKQSVFWEKAHRQRFAQAETGRHF